MASKSVEEILEAIERYRLVSTKDLATLRTRWFKPSRKDPADAEVFRQWLTVNRYVTEFVAKVVSGRKADQLVLGDYRLQDQLYSGPMAGAYLAIDALDRPVAIEVLSADSTANRAVLAGFEQAARRAMQIRHVNVGRTIDIGQAHGMHYLVKEYLDGLSLDDILQKRGKLPYLQAARLFALACAGLEALHKDGVPGGDLSADCLLLAPTGKKSSQQRTVKILHAGIKRQLFDETAIGRSMTIMRGIPDELQLAQSSTFAVGSVGSLDPPRDIFRLGCVFYRTLTGKEPFAPRELEAPTRPARPIRELIPDVPEMLAEIVEQMIDPDPARRQQKAAHVGKALRVFLATEEQAKEEEERLVTPAEASTNAFEEEAETAAEADADGEDDNDAPPPRTRAAAAVAEGIEAKATALWDDLRPTNRELLFLAAGALALLLLIAFFALLTGVRITFFAGLAMGAAASYFVERYLRWREQRQDAESAEA